MKTQVKWDTLVEEKGFTDRLIDKMYSRNDSYIYEYLKIEPNILYQVR